ncbi:MAG TPA: hypothetical protein VJ877_00310, partial [Bacteroidales bacterium]|nr:hypothetical protein [Bacteroidales bacterium]
FIVKGGRLEKRNIDVVKLNEKTLVFRGLEEGELLVTQALINVQEGTRVRTGIDEVAGNSMAGSSAEVNDKRISASETLADGDNGKGMNIKENGR